MGLLKVGVPGILLKDGRIRGLTKQTIGAKLCYILHLKDSHSRLIWAQSLCLMNTTKATRTPTGSCCLSFSSEKEALDVRR